VKTLEAENARLRGDLDEARRRAEACEARAEASEARSETLERRAAELEAAVREEAERAHEAQEALKTVASSMASPTAGLRAPAEDAARLEGGLDELLEQREMLRGEVMAANHRYAEMRQDYEKLETALEECEGQKKELAAAYAFTLLDSDKDGRVVVGDMKRFELFIPYGPEVLKLCFDNWQYASGAAGLMNVDDFLLFIRFAEDKTLRPSQNFWFRVLDMDGDGVIGRQDMRWFYDQVDKSECPYCISFEDMLCQVLDMARVADAEQGIRLADLRRTKLAQGVIGLLTNHNNMLLQRSTAEWGRGDIPL